jgi:hypothetical protein
MSFQNQFPDGDHPGLTRKVNAAPLHTSYRRVSLVRNEGQLIRPAKRNIRFHFHPVGGVAAQNEDVLQISNNLPAAQR